MSNKNILRFQNDLFIVLIMIKQLSESIVRFEQKLQVKKKKKMLNQRSHLL
jgi:hypothetical protein